MPTATQTKYNRRGDAAHLGDTPQAPGSDYHGEGHGALPAPSLHKAALIKMGDMYLIYLVYRNKLQIVAKMRQRISFQIKKKKKKGRTTKIDKPFKKKSLKK